jgi:hypothetical protein
LLRAPEAGKADLNHPCIGCDTRQGDVSRRVKRQLSERFREKRFELVKWFER